MFSVLQMRKQSHQAVSDIWAQGIRPKKSQDETGALTPMKIQLLTERLDRNIGGCSKGDNLHWSHKAVCVCGESILDPLPREAGAGCIGASALG